VKELFNIEEQMYPGVSRAQQSWIEEVESNRSISTLRTESGLPCKVSYYTGTSGKRYGFVEEDIPANMQLFSGYKEALRSNEELSYQQFKMYGKPKKTGFKPTVIYNYRIQGESGELLYLILGKLIRDLINTDNFDGNLFIINTIHDSILFDCKSDYVKQAAQYVLGVMEDTPRLFENKFNTPFNVPVQGEAESGLCWGTKKKLETTTYGN
jgi:hypothetical protein